MTARDARAEAQAVVGDGLEARVLEPSPPAVADPAWFADDPVQGAGPAGDRVVAPVPLGAAMTWDAWLADHPDRAGWAAERWLGAHRRLVAPPPGFAATRLALHRVAVYAVAPARRRANGKFGLRFTAGGFGTPFFGDDEQVRVDGDRIVRQAGGEAREAPLTTLAAAAALALDGPPDGAWAEGLDVPPLGDPDADLAVDPRGRPAAGRLVRLRLVGARGAAGRAGVGAGRAHPALARALRRRGRPAGPRAPRRATYGASPGDADHAEPYLYVLPVRAGGRRPASCGTRRRSRGDPAPGRVRRGRRPARRGAGLHARAPGRARGLSGGCTPTPPTRSTRSTSTATRPTAEGRPGLRLNMIASVDGATTVAGLSGGLGGAGDKALFRALRSLADVVLVGAGTVRAEGYGPPRLPTTRSPPASAAARSRCRASPSSRARSTSTGSRALFAAPTSRPIVVTRRGRPGRPPRPRPRGRRGGRRGDGAVDLHGALAACSGETGASARSSARAARRSTACSRRPGWLTSSASRVAPLVDGRGRPPHRRGPDLLVAAARMAWRRSARRTASSSSRYRTRNAPDRPGTPRHPRRAPR